MLRWFIAIVLLAHGIGHTMGVLQVFKVATVNPEWHGDSWLLTGPIGATLTQAVGVVLWTVATLGFIAVAAAVVGWLPASWFAPAAIASSVLSLVGILLFPAAFPTFSTIGAVAVDLVVLASTTLLHWVPSDLAP